MALPTWGNRLSILTLHSQWYNPRCADWVWGREELPLPSLGARVYRPESSPILALLQVVETVHHIGLIDYIAGHW